MEYNIQELEDIAAARLVRSNLEVSHDPSENLLAAIAAGLLLNEIVTAQAEREYIEQSMTVGRLVLEGTAA